MAVLQKEAQVMSDDNLGSQHQQQYFWKILFQKTNIIQQLMGQLADGIDCPPDIVFELDELEEIKVLFFHPNAKRFRVTVRPAVAKGTNFMSDVLILEANTTTRPQLRAFAKVSNFLNDAVMSQHKWFKFKK